VIDSVKIFLAIVSAALGGCGERLKDNRPDLRVLFVGNSLTASHGLPAMVRDFAASRGTKIEFESVTPGGASLADEWHQGQARERLRAAKWDYVVLQQGPSSRPESQAELKVWARTWAEEARGHGAQPALYMVWPISGQGNGFSLVEKSYRNAALDSNSLFLPAGNAWNLWLESNDASSLYQPDGLHPTRFGTVLAALVIVRRLTGHRADSLAHECVRMAARLADRDDAAILKLIRTADQAVDLEASREPARASRP
jgi:hypothetical protein